MEKGNLNIQGGVAVGGAAGGDTTITDGPSPIALPIARPRKGVTVIYRDLMSGPPRPPLQKSFDSPFSACQASSTLARNEARLHLCGSFYWHKDHRIRPIYLGVLLSPSMRTSHHLTRVKCLSIMS